MLKFAVVREDPQLERALVERTGAKALLTVASGGCTALSLKAHFPSLEVAAFDLNPDQLAHCKSKAAAVASGELAKLRELSGGGEFEKLFEVLRHFLATFVGPPSALLERPGPFLSNTYWPVAFRLAFDESLLLAMFGPDAIRHAVRGSYPGYFQGAIERGLRAEGAASNPFLQHILLGRTLEDPAWFRAAVPLPIEWIEGALPEVPQLSRFGVVSLSNVFDWSDDSVVTAWSKALLALPRGAHIVWRQLNNRRDWSPFFASAFEVDAALSSEWTTRERSLFYEQVTVAVRR